MIEVGSFTTLRKPDESIVIGVPDSEFCAVVTVRKVRGNKVYLNVSAPKSVPVLRGELVEASEQWQQ